jgi:hypothetical protein
LNIILYIKKIKKLKKEALLACKKKEKEAPLACKDLIHHP